MSWFKRTTPRRTILPAEAFPGEDPADVFLARLMEMMQWDQQMMNCEIGYTLRRVMSQEIEGGSMDLPGTRHYECERMEQAFRAFVRARQAR